VRVNGIPKLANNGFSSFFPTTMSMQEVLNSIDEAYNDRVFIQGNISLGETSNGMIREMYINRFQEIISAFPLYEPNVP
jgi:hypothetical protein